METFLDFLSLSSEFSSFCLLVIEVSFGGGGLVGSLLELLPDL